MRRAFFIFAGVTIFISQPAHAWYDHVVVMKWVQTRLEKEAPLPTGSWEAQLPDTSSTDPKRYFDIASLLLLQQKAELKSLSAKTYHELLQLAAEDPDHGMDNDLPDSADPNDDRKFMGGVKGPGAQGFRHMYWPGWKWRHPIATFQIPTRVLGQSPDRIELLANEARERIRKGDLVWGVRILGWTLHYLQDLTQPFHTVQFPSLNMLPLSALFTWPPTNIFPHLVQETTRVMTNYHWAYEGYIQHALSKGEDSPFKNCFTTSGGSFLVASPRDLALELIDRSIKRAPTVGRSLMDLVGTHLKDPEVSIPLNPKQIDNDDLLKNPAIEDARHRINTETCEALGRATDASVWIVNWAIKK